MPKIINILIPLPAYFWTSIENLTNNPKYQIFFIGDWERKLNKNLNFETIFSNEHQKISVLCEPGRNRAYKDPTRYTYRSNFVPTLNISDLHDNMQEYTMMACFLHKKLVTVQNFNSLKLC